MEQEECDENITAIHRKEEALFFRGTRIYREMMESARQLEKNAIERLIYAECEQTEMQARTEIAATRLFLNWMELIIQQGKAAEMVIQERIDNGLDPT